MQIPVHLQGGKADVDAVHVRQPVADPDQGQQPQACLAQRGFANSLQTRVFTRIRG